MLVHAWLAVVLLAATATAGTLTKRLGLFGALLGIFSWGVAGFGALDLEYPVGTDTGAATAAYNEVAIAILALVPAAVLIPVGYLAAAGRWKSSGPTEARGPSSSITPPDAGGER
jgi:hypothetical protein